MRKIVSTVLAFIAVSISLSAQVLSSGQTGLPSFDPSASTKEIRFSGAYKGYIGGFDKASGGLVFNLDYNKFTPRGFGYGIAAQVIRDNVTKGGGFGVPVKVAYRSPIISSGYNVAYGAYNAANIALRNRHNLDKMDTWIDILGSLVLSMFSRAEVFAGLTPGCLVGDSVFVPSDIASETWQGVFNDGSFFLSADAGFSLCYRLYRFNISLTPAIHYYIVNPYRYQNTDLTVKPMKWQYTAALGIGYLF